MWRGVVRSAASNLRNSRRYSTAIPLPSIIHKRGIDVLHDPWFNKVRNLDKLILDKLLVLVLFLMCIFNLDKLIKVRSYNSLVTALSWLLFC